jgi:beta-galactosidase/beta-glucuronidase
LGSAFFEEALERRLKAFKEIGVNAIRCSHNPMAPEFYDLCDRLGFLVMDEAFDEWIGGKRKWAEGWNAGVAARRGYNEAFEDWGVSAGIKHPQYCRFCRSAPPSAWAGTR